MYARIVKCILKSVYHVLYNTKCIHCVEHEEREKRATTTNNKNRNVDKYRAITIWCCEFAEK